MIAIDANNGGIVIVLANVRDRDHPRLMVTNDPLLHYRCAADEKNCGDDLYFDHDHDHHRHRHDGHDDDHDRLWEAEEGTVVDHHLDHVAVPEEYHYTIVLDRIHRHDRRHLHHESVHRGYR
jgi:hypothetical protein